MTRTLYTHRDTLQNLKPDLNTGGETDMTVSVLLEGYLKDGERDGFTALLSEKFRLTKTFDGFQTIDLTYNVADPNNWVITERWDSKENYEKYLQFRQEDGTLDEVASVCRAAPSVRIFDIADTATY